MDSDDDDDDEEDSDEEDDEDECVVFLKYMFVSSQLLIITSECFLVLFCSDEDDESDEDVKPQKKELKKVSHSLVGRLTSMGSWSIPDRTLLLETPWKLHDAIILRFVK